MKEIYSGSIDVLSGTLQCPACELVQEERREACPTAAALILFLGCLEKIILALAHLRCVILACQESSLSRSPLEVIIPILQDRCEG